MLLGEWRKVLEKKFLEAGFESPSLEGDYIASEVMRIPHMELFLHEKKALTPEQEETLTSFLARRLANEPFQYIFGWTPFRYLDLEVGRGVLIPRPETEAMVDLILQRLPLRGSMAELGTGSGAIALSVGGERRDVKAIAEKNRAKYALDNVTLLLGDLFSPFPAGEKFDVLAANLPYIDPGERENLPPNVRDYEPPEALFAPEKGFALIRKAIAEAPEYLREKSALIFEMSPEQGEEAVKCALDTGFFRNVFMEKDPFDTASDSRRRSGCRTLKNRQKKKEKKSFPGYFP